MFTHAALNGYLTLFRAMEGEEKAWHPTSVTPFLVQKGSLAAMGYGNN